MTNKLFTFILTLLALLAMADLKVFSSNFSFHHRREKEKYSIYQLPEGIILADSPRSAAGECVQTATEKKLIKGSGGLIRMCVTFGNPTDENITLILPAGLTFISESTGEEAGILLQDVELEVEAGHDLQILLYAYSLDFNHHLTAGMEDVYRLGGIKANPGIMEITRMIKDLSIDENHVENQEQSDRLMYIDITLQDAVYAVLLHGALNDADKESIKTLE